MTIMNENRSGIVLVVDDTQKLMGTISDGDIRRALLNEVDMGAEVTELLNRKVGTRFEQPVSALVGQPSGKYVDSMKAFRILHLPLVDEDSRVVGLVTLNDLIAD